jgi:paraquat-inducible protein B
MVRERNRMRADRYAGVVDPSRLSPHFVGPLRDRGRPDALKVLFASMLLVLALEVASGAEGPGQAVDEDGLANSLSNLRQAVGQRLAAPSSRRDELPEGVPFTIRFTHDLQGLSVGAPVRIQGYRVGTVRDVAVAFDADTNNFAALVRIDLVPDRITIKGERLTDAAALPAVVVDWIGKGLRAHVQGGLMGLGQTYIALRIDPEASEATADGRDGVAGIPAGRQRSRRVETLVESVLQRLERLPLEDTLDEVKAGVVALRRVVESIESESVAVLQGFRDATSAAGRAATQAGRTAANLEKNIGPKARLWRDVDSLLNELTGTARALRLLITYLERHPEALLTGKSGGNP